MHVSLKIHIYILPETLNLDALLVEETSRVKPKKPAAGIPRLLTFLMLFYKPRLLLNVSFSFWCFNFG